MSAIKTIKAVVGILYAKNNTQILITKKAEKSIYARLLGASGRKN